MSQVTLTKAAADKVRTMLEDNNMQDGYLRFKVEGGGCTGLTYGMAAEEEPTERDLVFTHHGVSVLVDKFDIGVVDGTTIDFKESLLGGGFTIDNPLASVACGCGASFRTKTNKGTPEQC
ncbi:MULTISPECIES: HesB/IscA family protein [Nosocomiicoccus]|uniref:HesB/IscA family protein n=1 Tax=Nosocomiicoccus TaxID=489909 RepID=UPI00042688B0|nr:MULTISPECIES: iron-sulfur cluster assembly accessory protein [Nosocomiicoccus]MDK6863787.1 iron-sulfur cluster assembly accessory protein [Nosocomiicoccus ampullae]